MRWTQFLCGEPAEKYIFQKEPYEEAVRKAAQYLRDSDALLIGAGAGLSTAAGMTYSGERFENNFKEFIEKYGMRDMYSAGFYPFPIEEARWGYWAKQVEVNRIAPPALPLYHQLYEMVKDKEYFVLTTNVDHQFHKSGFEENKIFATQGDYGLIQCARGCHPKTYDATALFEKMNQTRVDCNIPADMVPKCPVCGGPMAMNLRCDQYFVEDEKWQESAEAYDQFLSQLKNKKVVLLELGVGFNTPAIIRFPFEKMMREYSKAILIRLNLDEAVVPKNFDKRAVGINEDIAKSLGDIKQKMEQVVVKA